jgi:RNA polymerase sigma factor for flagellar operon FliA
MEAGLKTYRQVAARDERERLILDHLEDVRHILGRVAARLPAGVDRQNLESAGVLGLVEAAGQFDPTRGVDFGAYARVRIRGAILDEMRRNCPLPQRMLKRLARVKQAYLRLDPPATTQAVAHFTGMTAHEVEECLEAASVTRTEPWNEDLTLRLADRRAPAGRAEHNVETTEIKRQLADAIEQLPERERLVITLYYLEDLRLKEIGDALRLSESRVSRILTRAENRLRQLVGDQAGE